MIYLHVIRKIISFCLLSILFFYSYLCIVDNIELLHLTKCYTREDFHLLISNNIKTIN